MTQTVFKPLMRRLVLVFFVKKRIKNLCVIVKIVRNVTNKKILEKI